MKVLFNKLKKCSKVLLTLFIISLILYTGSLIFLTINLTSLSGIQNYSFSNILFILDMLFNWWINSPYN